MSFTFSEDNAIPSKGKTSHEADNNAVPVRDGQTPQEIIAEQVDSDQEKMALIDEEILARAAEQAEQTGKTSFVLQIKKEHSFLLITLSLSLEGFLPFV